MLAEGVFAPDFTLGNWSLQAALRNGPVLLAFFKISCPTCQLAFPYLDRLASGVPVVAISQDDRIGTEQVPAPLPGFPAHPVRQSARYTASNHYRIGHVPSLFLQSGRTAGFPWRWRVSAKPTSKN
jgi:hypothetical protein